MSKKLLIIGGASLVGSTIIDYATDDYEIFTTENNTPITNPKVSSIKVNLLDEKKQILDYIEKIKPSAVIHTVAFPNVDFCESNHELTDLLHVKITKDISEICSSVNSKLIYFSTDAVFSGNNSIPYNELDTPNPLSYYGKTKLEAEKIILQNTNNIILRTTVIYGWHIRSRFTNWVLDTLKNKKPVTAFVDQYNTPTLVDDLAKSVFSIIEKDLSGLFHASGKSCLNRFEFAQKLAISFGLDKNLVIPTKSSDILQIAPRPKNGCLDSSQFEDKSGIKFNEIDSGIDHIFSLSNNSTTNSNKV
jgi:dTDP-4-dehydrorhamnose reductase